MSSQRPKRTIVCIAVGMKPSAMKVFSLRNGSGRSRSICRAAFIAVS
jgi:hypothetical protein